MVCLQLNMLQFVWQISTFSETSAQDEFFSQENGSFFCCQFLCCGPLQFESGYSFGCKNVLVAPYENSVPRRQVITTLLPCTVKSKRTFRVLGHN